VFSAHARSPGALTGRCENIGDVFLFSSLAVSEWKTACKRLATSAEIAQVIAFVASANASYMTGADRGLTLGTGGEANVDCAKCGDDQYINGLRVLAAKPIIDHHKEGLDNEHLYSDDSSHSVG
jgi:hypothetical protein